MVRRNRIFTKLQGQYLAFIHLYTKLHGRSWGLELQQNHIARIGSARR
jgi:hypothetical protein